MNIKPILSFLFIAFIISGCGKNKELKKDASDIADAMCRSIEIMNRLKATDPQDTVKINDLQLKYQRIQSEMEILYTEFRKKYEDRMKDPQFNKEFANELRKAILNCRYLSKEDRVKYEKEIE
jgi:hypothetical protein